MFKHVSKWMDVGAYESAVKEHGKNKLLMLCFNGSNQQGFEAYLRNMQPRCICLNTMNC